MEDKRKESDEIDKILSEFEEKYGSYKNDSDNEVKEVKADVTADEKVEKTEPADKAGEDDEADNISSDNNKKTKKEKNKNKEPSKFAIKWKALAKWKRVTIIVVAAILLIALISFCVVWGIYNGFRTDINEGNLGISSEISDKYGDTDVFNVAIFGLDTRDENSFSGRSDSIIIVSVDKKTNSVKMTSILRDSYVAIEGHGNQKITHAYMYGGAELAIKTINQNYNMNITDYATISFYKLAKAIDVLGGIDINITESEMKQINEIGSSEGKIIDKVTEYGDVHLNGDQAAVYVRLRHNDSDVVRSSRQVTVINALITQARKVSPSKYAEVIKSIMSFCETSLTFSEVMSYAPMITQELNISAMTVPGDEDNAIGGIYEGSWVWRYDLAAAAERIHYYIYGEVPPTTVSATTTKKSTKTTTTAAAVKADGTTAGHTETTTEVSTTLPPETQTSAETTTLAPVETTTSAATQSAA